MTSRPIQRGDIATIVAFLVAFALAYAGLVVATYHRLTVGPN